MVEVRNWISRLGFGGRLRESKPAAQAPRMIPGGTNAPELFMKPIDVVDEDMPLLSGWMQLKLDGIGAGMVERRIVTPQGTPFDAALHCLPGLIRVEEAIGQPMMIDGEYVEEDGYDATMAAFKRGEGAGVFWIYDAVPLDDWIADRCTQPIEERLEILERAAAAANSPFVGLLKAHLVEEPYLAVERTREFWDLGYEGTVIKRRGSRYVRRRSQDWVRLKKVVTVDVIVTDVLHSGGRLSKLVCKDPARPIPPFIVAAGWNEREAAILETFDTLHPNDRWIEIAYNLKAGGERPRHARFVRLRMNKEVTHGK